MRSRTVRRPAVWWRSTFSFPPICRARASRRLISSTSGCQVTASPWLSDARQRDSFPREFARRSTLEGLYHNSLVSRRRATSGAGDQTSEEFPIRDRRKPFDDRHEFCVCADEYARLSPLYGLNNYFSGFFRRHPEQLFGSCAA